MKTILVWAIVVLLMFLLAIGTAAAGLPVM
jgi:predicted small secreted protein